MKILSFDIGGANIKKLVFDVQKNKILKNESYYFPFWERFDDFDSFLSQLKEKADRVGFVFTAEMVDAFSSRREGVRFLVQKCSRLFSQPRFMDRDRKLLLEDEISEPLKLAGANYVASLHFMEEHLGRGILLDIGSTTTDILPFRKGHAPYARGDLERMMKKQLLYMGCMRTPLAAVASTIRFRGREIKPAGELFAVTADVYSALGELESYPTPTPDGRGKDRDESLQRVARMVCSDASELGDEVWVLCREFRKAQVEATSHYLKKVAAEHGMHKAYLGGSGHFLGRSACEMAGMEYQPLHEVTDAYQNLPCLGLAEALGHEGV